MHMLNSALYGMTLRFLYYRPTVIFLLFYKCVSGYKIEIGGIQILGPSLHFEWQGGVSVIVSLEEFEK